MDSSNLTLYRRRYIPNELVLLKNDEIVRLEENLLITKWKTISQHTQFAKGISAFFFDKGWKVSKFLDSEGNLCYWYCDIVEMDINEAEDTITCVDLLFDVVVFPDGRVRVMDSDEAADAFEQGLITKEQLMKGLRSMNELLNVIYSDRFDRLQAVVNAAE